MTTKLQINQSIKVVHDALITHLNSFKHDNSTVFDYDLRKDGFGIYYFVLGFSEFRSRWDTQDGNLGFIRLRSLDTRLTEIVVEDSVWLEREPNIYLEPWDLEDEIPLKERKAKAAAVFDRFRSIHSEVRAFIIEQLQEDQLLRAQSKKSAKPPHEHMSKPNIQTRVFISYAREDIESALKIYDQLKAIQGITPWFDKESLLPGIRWRPAIKKAIRESDFFLALLSKRSTTKRGYVQTEMKEALEIWDQFPEDKAYLIPIRLEECEPSYEKLREVQCQDFFPGWDQGFQRVLRVINSAARPEINPNVSLLTGYEYRCAIVDFDNGLTNLAQICQRLNSIQDFFHFSYPSFPYEHKALREFGGQSNLYVPALPKSLYKQKSLLNADLVACLTKYLLAFKEDREVGHNFLSLPSNIDDTFLFITTHGLYETAKKAGCTFEKVMVYNVLTQLLIHFASGLGFHSEVRGCILDYCEEHSWMIKGLKKMRLCPSCASGVENEHLRRAVLAILADPLKV